MKRKEEETGRRDKWKRVRKGGEKEGEKEEEKGRERKRKEEKGGSSHDVEEV